jgi:hypothetical protein
MATGPQDMGWAGSSMLSGHGHGHSLISFLLYIVFFGWILIQEEEGVEEVSLAKFAITMTNVEQEGRIIRSFSLMVFFFFFFFPSD